MKLAEKLGKLTQERNKAELSRTAGLPATAISDYVSKGYIPKADTALKLARALEVPVEWLIDDEADFPVPEPAAAPKTIRDFHDLELIADLGRRFSLNLEFLYNLHRWATGEDLIGYAKRGYAIALDETDPQVESILKDLETIYWHFSTVYYRRDLDSAISTALDKREEQMEFDGDEMPEELHNWQSWIETIDQWFRTDPGVVALRKLETLRARHLVPTMRDDAEEQRQSRLSELRRMHLAQPAPTLKAAKSKTKAKKKR